MYFHQLEAFVNVVKYKSFSQAAKAMFLSQPTVSSHVKALENELNVQLIVRSTKDVVLSDAGKVFYGYATELLRLRDIACQQMQDFSQNISGSLPVAAAPAASQYLLPGVLARFHECWPQLSVSVSQLDNVAVIAAIERFEVEFGITDGACPSAKCQFEPVLEDKLVLTMPDTSYYRAFASHFLQQTESEILPDVTYEIPESLQREHAAEVFSVLPLIWGGSATGYEAELTAFLEDCRLTMADLNIVARMPSIESVRQSVLSGLGAAFLPYSATSDVCSAGQLLSFSFESRLMHRTYYLVRHKNRMLSPGSEELIALLHKF